MTTFQLKVQRIGAECWFELRWGKGQSLQATLPYPPELSLYYEEWRQAYLSFYQTSQRGRVVESGGLSAFPADWRTKLVQAEAKLQSVFQPWLRSGELFEIRQAIAQTQSSSGQPSSPIDLLLACRSSELERLPWESWDLGADFASSCPIRIARTPSNIRASATILQPQLSRRRIRVLAILGDETGLDFQADRAAITSLKPLADLHFVERQPQHDPASFKDTICHAIADARGWDMLFFVGHSDETTHTGGALRIAPGVELQLSEIAPKLAIARSKGLKFALFNSCSGLDLAHSLIDLGLSQVAIMREPIHNRAAQLFLMQFIQALTQFRDVHDAMRLACKHLKEVDSLAYPSAHLVPSLFRHPEALLFRLEPVGLKQALQRWKPSRREGIAIVTLSLLSLLHPVQNVLLDQRMFVQAIYRDLTGQLPTQPPPIALVHIDEASLAKTNIKNRNPIDRRYLAQVIDRLSDSKPAVVGIDYVLDTQQPGNDRRLAQAVQTAIAQNRTYFVFAALANDHTSAPETGVLPETRIALPQWSLQGNILTYSPLLVNLPPMQGCRQTCPFAYVVSMAALAGNNPNSLNAPLPQLSHSADLRTQLLTFIQRNRTAGSAFYFLSQAHLPSIATFSELLWQTWLQPIHDFSIPPEVIYTRIPSVNLLEGKQKSLSQIVLLGPGGYKEAGVEQLGEDNFPLPSSMAYWRTRSGATPPSYIPQILTGVEAHAYSIYHLLNQRLLVPLPDLWLIGIFAILGKGCSIFLMDRRLSKRWWILIFAHIIMIHGLAVLQSYISAGILIPYLCPLGVLMFYGTSTFYQQRRT